MLKVLSVIITIIITAQIPLSVFAMEPIETGPKFKRKNYQLQYEICNTTTSAAAQSLVGTPLPSGEGGGCGNDADNDPANKTQIWDFLVNKFKSKNYSEEEAQNAAAGVMGNWAQESSFDSNKIKEGLGCNDSSAYGIAQWCFGRIDKLKEFARQRNKLDKNGEATCLGIQLEYMWSEMESSDFSHLLTTMKGKSPSEAASVFNLGGGTGRGFEVGANNDKRMGFADQIYTEKTGKGVGSLGTQKTNNGNSSAPTNCTSRGSAQNAAASGTIPATAECKAMQEEIAKLKRGNKITFDKEAAIQKDIDSCNTGSIKRCDSGGGANPNTLRGIVAAANAPGINSIQLWNINSEHPCDEYDHPVGLATDIKQCNGQNADPSNTACQALFDYLIANKDKLNISYIIWDGDHCNSKKGAGVSCRGDHADHIHVSFNSSSVSV